MPAAAADITDRHRHLAAGTDCRVFRRQSRSGPSDRDARTSEYDRGVKPSPAIPRTVATLKQSRQVPTGKSAKREKHVKRATSGMLLAGAPACLIGATIAQAQDFRWKRHQRKTIDFLTESHCREIR